MSDLFGGLLQSGDGSRYAVERYLNVRREFWSTRKPPDWIYNGPEDFILTHGRYWRGASCPDEYREHCGPLMHCFVNAMSAALAHPELTYVEGVYSVAGLPKPHGWCVDTQDRIVELTFNPDGGDNYLIAGHAGGPGLDNSAFAYYGVPFPAVEYVVNHFHVGGLGMLHPDGPLKILTYHFDPTRTSV